jgi:hypothetical protein
MAGFALKRVALASVKLRRPLGSTGSGRPVVKLSGRDDPRQSPIWAASRLSVNYFPCVALKTHRKLLVDLPDDIVWLAETCFRAGL